METIKELWQKDRALVIVFVVAVLAILYYIYKQNNNGQGTTAVTTGNNPNTETPTAETEQLSTILAKLGHLTPVTNSTTLQPIDTTTNNTVNNLLAPVTTTVTNSGSVAQTVAAGIGMDTARDAAIKAAEVKYPGASNAAALQAAIAAIQKTYPRSGATS